MQSFTEHPTIQVIEDAQMAVVVRPAAEQAAEEEEEEEDAGETMKEEEEVAAGTADGVGDEHEEGKLERKQLD